jgi:hypothetical protein
MHPVGDCLRYARGRRDDLVHHHEHGKEGVKTLSQKDITEKIDEKKTTTAESLVPGCQAVQMQPWSPPQTEVERTLQLCPAIRAILRQNASSKVDP